MHRRVGQLPAIANSSKVTVTLKDRQAKISAVFYSSCTPTPLFFLLAAIFSISSGICLYSKGSSHFHCTARLGSSPLAVLLGNCADSCLSFLFRPYKEIGLRYTTLQGCCWDWCQKGLHGTKVGHSIIKVMLSARNFTHFWCQSLQLPEILLQDLKEQKEEISLWCNLQKISPRKDSKRKVFTWTAQWKETSSSNRFVSTQVGI